MTPGSREKENGTVAVTLTLSARQKKITPTQTPPPNTHTGLFTHTHALPCHLSGPLSVQYISSWQGKALLTRQVSAFSCSVALAVKERDFFFFFWPLPVTGSSASIFPLLGESDCTKPSESIGYRETARQSQSRFCKDWAGLWMRIMRWLKWSKTSKPVQAGQLDGCGFVHMWQALFTAPRWCSGLHFHHLSVSVSSFYSCSVELVSLNI